MVGHNIDYINPPEPTESIATNKAALGLENKEEEGNPVRSASTWKGWVPITCANKSANLVSSKLFNCVVLNCSPLNKMTES